MRIVRWNPFHNVTLLQNQMNRLFDEAVQGWPEQANGTTNWLPPADIYETDNDLVVTIDLPGTDPKSIDLRVENNVLTIRGERNFDQKLSSENFHRVERMYGSFARSFTLSHSVDSEKIRASYKDGVLHISLPKAEHAKPRRIQIAASAAAMLLFTLVTVCGLAAAPAFALPVQAQQVTSESFTWHGELVALDEASRALTVKSRVVGEQAPAELAKLKAGDRIVLTWSGFDKYADAINGVSRADAGKAGERFTFPVEFVTYEESRQYVTFKVPVPAEGMAELKSLKPGEWVTATSPHGSNSRTAPIAAIRPYVGSSSATSSN